MRQFGGQAPGTTLCCDTFPFHTTVSHLLLALNKLSCTRLPSQRSGLAVLIVPLYPSLHIKAHLHLHRLSNMVNPFIMCNSKARRLDGVVKYGFHIRFGL